MLLILILLYLLSILISKIQGLFCLHQEKAVAPFERYLDGAQFLLEHLARPLHHPTGSLGDNLVLGGGSEGERCPHRAADIGPDLLEGVNVLRTRGYTRPAVRPCRMPRV